MSDSPTEGQQPHPTSSWSCHCKQEATHARFAVAVKKAGGRLKAADQLGLSYSFVNMIIKGSRCPGRETMTAIKKLFGISMDDWSEEVK